MNIKVINKKEEFDQYVDELINTFRISSPSKYIILGFKVIDDFCNIKLSIYNESGISSNLEEVKVSCDDYFYETLKRIISQFRLYCNVVSEDVVNLNGDQYVTFRMITKNNDLFTIDGLDNEYAQKLLSSYEDVSENTNKELNNVGSSNILGIMLILTLLAVSFISIAFIMSH